MMNGPSGNYRFPFYAWISLAVLILAHTLLILNFNGGKHQLFLLVWWPCILIVDARVGTRKSPKVFSAARGWSHLRVIMGILELLVDH